MTYSNAAGGENCFYNKVGINAFPRFFYANNLDFLSCGFHLLRQVEYPAASSVLLLFPGFINLPGLARRVYPNLKFQSQSLCKGKLLFESRSFDHILTFCYLNCLPQLQRDATLAAIHRMLRPGGSLEVADFSAPLSRRAWWQFWWFRKLEPAVQPATLCDILPDQIHAAGFQNVSNGGYAETFAGTVRYYRATC